MRNRGCALAGSNMLIIYAYLNYVHNPVDPFKSSEDPAELDLALRNTIRQNIDAWTVD